MKKCSGSSILLVLLSASCGAAPSTSPPDPLIDPPLLSPSPTLSPIPSPLFEDLGAQKISVLLPEKKGESLPLLIFEHGYSLDENQVMSRTPFPRLAQKEGWILASSSLRGPAHWGNNQAIRLHDALIEHLLSRYGADPSRIYLVGFSMGGGTALLSGISGKFKPAAIASSQGWSDLSALSGSKYFPSILLAYESLSNLSENSPYALAEKLRGIAIYLEHGRFDQELPSSQSEKMHERLDSLGIPNSFRLFDGGHAESNIDANGIIAFFRGKKSNRAMLQ